MMHRALLPIALASACGGGTAKPSATTAPSAIGNAAPAPAAADPGASPFQLGEITVLLNKHPAIRLHANGTSEYSYPPSPEWYPSFTFRPDGTVLKDGATVAQLHADGTVTEPPAQTPKQLPLATALVTADVVTMMDHSDNPPMKIEFALSAKGLLSVSYAGLDGGQGLQTVEITGADTPGRRRAVLLELALLDKDQYPIWHLR
jgi:hypothetical protein